MQAQDCARSDCFGKFVQTSDAILKKKKKNSKMSIVQHTSTIDMRLKQLGHEMDAFAARCDKVFYTCESERFT